ncbi:hypothetical protein Acr_03g0014700 [Actinidia rufa]|uniref:Uncharacterized protein n=1 Tax=Actinidia rufa TaxID=165716 RepID=A0A7J0EEU6_9ERIC|nr:hypothetical protein Acr_03g0014700 [Actinidia rufa]
MGLSPTIASSPSPGYGLPVYHGKKTQGKSKVAKLENVGLRFWAATLGKYCQRSGVSPSLLLRASLE